MDTGESEQLHCSFRHFASLLRAVNGTSGAPDSFSGQGRVLRMLLAASIPLPQKELAAALAIRSQSLAELITKLENKGLVSRTRHPQDRRTSLVTLTELGHSIAVEQSIGSCFDPFSVLTPDERTALEQILGKLIQATQNRLPPTALS